MVCPVSAPQLNRKSETAQNWQERCPSVVLTNLEVKRSEGEVAGTINVETENDSALLIRRLQTLHANVRP